MSDFNPGLFHSEFFVSGGFLVLRLFYKGESIMNEEISLTEIYYGLLENLR